MKKEFIKIFCRNRKHDITLPFAMAQRVMESKDQLVLIYDENGKWTGVTLNKAEIISTDHDFERESQANRETRPDHLLGVRELTEADRKRIAENFTKIKKDLDL